MAMATPIIFNKSQLIRFVYAHVVAHNAQSAPTNVRLLQAMASNSCLIGLSHSVSLLWLIDRSMSQASDVKWQMGQDSGASIFNDDEGDDGDSEGQSEPAETAERPSAAKVQVVSTVNPADLCFSAAVICCHWGPMLWQMYFIGPAATTGLHHRDLVCPMS